MEASMVTLVIRTKKPTFDAFARPSTFDRLARRFYEARMQAAIREIEGKAAPRYGGL
jgi:hypothetical protein